MVKRRPKHRDANSALQRDAAQLQVAEGQAENTLTESPQREMLHLQQTIGNRRAQAMLQNGTLQRRWPFGSSAPDPASTPEAETLKILNGLDMTGLLLRLVGMPVAEQQKLREQLGVIGHLVDAPRILFAMMVVRSHIIAPGGPGGAAGPDQLEAAQDFLFFVLHNGYSMTGILNKMAGMPKAELDGRMARKAAFAPICDMPRFDYAYGVVTDKKKPATPYSDAAQVKEAEEFLYQDIIRICATIPRGQEAIDTMQKYNIQHNFGPAGGGSGYLHKPDKMMTFDAAKDTTRLALTFIHEINHARYANTGKTADAMKMNRQAYINKMVAEEAEGTVLSIEGKNQLKAGGVIDVSHTSYPLEAEYGIAYNKAVKKAKKANPKISEAELEKVGRKAGKARVVKGFFAGEVVVPDDRTYPVYYGTDWDDQHGVVHH